ncbi:MAG: carbohydrate ABC transporter permease [Candidatus Borkfalkiaceae bacterium]|nr:carbohydrate ABC transporter permease [Christensenellaceae bacterium]
MKKRLRLTAGCVAMHLTVFTLCLLVLLPFAVLIVKSFKDYDQEIFHPVSPTFPLHTENYEIAWLYVKNSIFNSFFVSGSIAFLSVLLSSVGGYAFSVFSFRGKELVYSLAVSLMMMPSILILTSKYVLVSVSLGLQDSFAGVILPQTAGLIPFGLLLLRGYFDALPKGLSEAAEIDGAGTLTQFIRIALPLSVPMVTTLFLMNFMTTWNDYLWPLMILRNEEKFTIPINLQSFTDAFYKTNQYYAPALAGYVIVSVPMLVLFGFTSRQFIQGMTAGAFKM